MIESGLTRDTSIVFKGEALEIEFTHPVIETREHVEWKRRRLQKRIQYRLGQKVPFDQIPITPAAGEVYSERTCFKVKLGQTDLYIGLHLIHQETPEMLPRLVDKLEELRNIEGLAKTQEALIISTISGLQKIIESNNVV